MRVCVDPISVPFFFGELSLTQGGRRCHGRSLLIPVLHKCSNCTLGFLWIICCSCAWPFVVAFIRWRLVVLLGSDMINSIMLSLVLWHIFENLLPELGILHFIGLRGFNGSREGAGVPDSFGTASGIRQERRSILGPPS